MEIKKIIKYSLIYTLLTSFLSKTVYLIFNYQNYGQIGFLELFFNQFVFSIIYAVILFLLFREIRRRHNYSFNKILIASILTIFMVYIFKYSIDWLFYSLNSTIHPNNKTENTGLLYLANSMGEIFSKPNFSIINDYFINPYYLIMDSLKSVSIKNLLVIIFSSKILLTTIVIFYFSLYYLFEKLNQKKIDAIIPIKNNLILLKIANKPTWWIFLIYIPFIRLIPKYLINMNISKMFDKKASFAIGMTLLPWFFFGKIALDKTSELRTLKQ